MSEQASKETTNKANGGNTKQPTKPPRGKRVPVFVDTEPEEVVELDNEGYEIMFLPESMCVLPDDVVKGLCKFNKDLYTTALAAFKQNVKHAENPAPNVHVLGNVLGDSAQGKLNRLPKSTKGLHRTWRRPDEVDEFIDQGYRVMLKDGERYEVNARGKVDLVGMEGPMAIHRNRLRVSSMKSKDRRTAVEPELAEKLKKIHPRVKVISNEED